MDVGEAYECVESVVTDHFAVVSIADDPFAADDYFRHDDDADSVVGSDGADSVEFEGAVDAVDVDAADVGDLKFEIVMLA